MNMSFVRSQRTPVLLILLALVSVVGLYGMAVFTTNADSSASNPFHMQNGLLTVEVESAPLADEWIIGTELTGASGSYYYWDYPSARANAGEGVLEYYVNIPEAGRYRFQIRSATGPVADNTEQNDVFARIQGAGSEAVGIKKDNSSQVSMGNDWFKVYQNKGNREWTWISNHVDNNAHQVYFDFDSAGVYTVGLAGRSEKFSIDRWVLYDPEQLSEGDATNLSNSESPQDEPSATSTPEPDETPDPTETPPEDVPTAPLTFTVDPNNGRPIIMWPEDENAEWFNFWIIGDNGTIPLADGWFPIPSAIYADTVAKKVECSSGECRIAPDINPLGGEYDVWMQTWGNGAYSTGGNSDYDGWSLTTFSLPTTRPDAPSGLTVTSVENGKPEISWTSGEYVTWYQVWIGTADDLVQQHFELWSPASEFGCANAGQCTFVPDISLPGGGTALPADTYVIWIQSWGPGGFNQSDLANGWVEVGTFTVP